jgi:hypothetical protein
MGAPHTRQSKGQKDSLGDSVGEAGENGTKNICLASKECLWHKNAKREKINLSQRREDAKKLISRKNAKTREQKEINLSQRREDAKKLISRSEGVPLAQKRENRKKLISRKNAKREKINLSQRGEDAKKLISRKCANAQKRENRKKLISRKNAKTRKNQSLANAQRMKKMPVSGNPLGLPAAGRVWRLLSIFDI